MKIQLHITWDWFFDFLWIDLRFLLAYCNRPDSDLWYCMEIPRDRNERNTFFNRFRLECRHSNEHALLILRTHILKMIPFGSISNATSHFVGHETHERDNASDDNCRNPNRTFGFRWTHSFVHTENTKNDNFNRFSSPKSIEYENRIKSALEISKWIVFIHFRQIIPNKNISHSTMIQSTIT